MYRMHSGRLLTVVEGNSHFDNGLGKFGEFFTAGPARNPHSGLLNAGDWRREYSRHLPKRKTRAAAQRDLDRLARRRGWEEVQL